MGCALDFNEEDRTRLKSPGGKDSLVENARRLGCSEGGGELSISSLFVSKYS